MIDLARVQKGIAAVSRSHHRLFQTLDVLTDDVARQPSRLPDWTVGHVLTHIARNADSFVGIAQGAMAGEVWLQYPGGREQRAADIEAGAGRPAVDLIDDVHESAQRLEAAWKAMTPTAWAGNGANVDGRQWPCVLLPFHRRREVEVHHVDLGLGYEPTDWPEDYVAAELPGMLELLPDRLPDAGDRANLVAWLLGRADQPTLAVAPWQSQPRYYHDAPIRP